MPRRKPTYEFPIHVDPSCLSAPMDEETPTQHIDVEKTEEKVPPAAPVTTTTIQDTEAHGDVGNIDINSWEHDLEDDTLETQVAKEENTDTCTADDVATDHADTSATEQDTSIIEEEEEKEEENQATEHEDEGDESILSSVESRDDEVLEDDKRSTEIPCRRTSKRTEELIHAAARDIVSRIGKHNGDHEGDQEDESIISTHTDDSHGQPNLDDQEHSELGAEEDSEPTPTGDDGGDSSSQHEATDEDVFSDKSPRSSLGSYDGSSESGKATAIADNASVATRTPRISDISQYDKEEDFIPTARGTPRPPFRTPSDVRAIQMSSPPPSTFGSGIGSPRSSKRAFPTVSRLGSPAPSAQYSPKNRTPSRFKVKKEAPLVLLHATILPLRWVWGDLVNSLDSSEMSEETKTLREAWRTLQDRVGDTLLERGILLGHPQNDYEVLEERLLEALELPMRRRARILECGHYIGPANEDNIGDDSESEDGYDAAGPSAQRHWCNTCKNEIRYDSLGPGKIFRVKVYASNGLMKAGAWAACWREMERVDIELEPIVEASVQDELTHLATAQQEHDAIQQEQVDIAAEIAHQMEENQNTSYPDQPDLMHARVEIPSAVPESASARRSRRGEERRLREEERLREIYGTTPVPESDYTHSETAAHEPHPDSYVPPPSPRSPSEEAFERKQSRRRPSQSDSLPELLFRAVRVLMQDRKNVVIAALSLFVVLMALRTAPQPPQFDSTVYEAKNMVQMQHDSVPDAPPAVTREQDSSVDSALSYSLATQSVATQLAVVQESIGPVSTYTAIDPCATHFTEQQSIGMTDSVLQEAVAEKKTVKVVETVTETETVKVETVTQVETMKVKVTVTETAVAPEGTVGLVGTKELDDVPVMEVEAAPKTEAGSIEIS